ncbi:DWNN-domain-containing protein [Ophiobolus disseminans]|uniref:DWNN-domain-containing protein n=1 Tax=Ophiobolus disseminans TaxID=1469910 RepID=A0A6A6ZFF6_9PLEO|nr:DWNN-domain-containing protein [Ophiobolus disseminans]
MSSSVFFKFKNSLLPERILFDGTGISVFELKRDIIIASGLGDGTDFNLHIFPQEDTTPNAEYKDDTTLIPRSATVVCVRRPAPRGQGRAARYISGKPPVRAITKDTSRPAVAAAPSATPGVPLSEADAEAAFLAESAQVWDAQKETLSHVKPTYNKNRKPVNVPNHDPPTGYLCKRCLVKGHWIQACPTNDDPDFKPVFQAKRTTGIPRSFLKTVEKPVDEEAAKGIMLNADGEYVQVMTDTKTWEKFQEKANASKAQAANADAASKEIRERGLECPIDKRRFVDPVKTPCCGKSYCRDCIDNALAEGDLICPNCGKEEVLMDDLVSDADMLKSLHAFDAEKAKEKEEQAKAAAANEPDIPANIDPNEHQSAMSVAALPKSLQDGSDTDESSSSKKRKQPPTNIQPPTAPKAMRQQADPASSLEANFIQEMEALKNGQAPSMGMPMPMGFNPQFGFNGPQMGFNMPFNPQQQQQFGPQMGYGMPMMPNHMQFPGFQQNQGQQGQMPPNEAYDRQPVNNRNRNRRSRAPDYRYL